MNRDVLARYAAVLAAQLEALDDEDIDRFEALADERDELAGALADRKDADGAGATAEPPSPDDVARCIELDRRVLEKLRSMRQATLSALREGESRRPAALAYAAGDTRPGMLDVKL